ncbi:hypothetical protein KAW18_11625 [candidate division WOR-3 bacterium]|nr:hypothetical protein [candidate division WOR-3 bacterium]
MPGKYTPDFQEEIIKAIECGTTSPSYDYIKSTSNSTKFMFIISMTAILSAVIITYILTRRS